MKAYLLEVNDGRETGRIYMVIGTECVEAAKVLAERVGCNWERIGVGGSWDVDPLEPICVSGLWPYFTANPGSHEAARLRPQIQAVAKRNYPAK